MDGRMEGRTDRQTDGQTNCRKFYTSLAEVTRIHTLMPVMTEGATEIKRQKTHVALLASTTCATTNYTFD